MVLCCLFFALMATAVGKAHRADPQLHTLTSTWWRSSVNLLALVLLARGRPATLLGDRRPALWIRGLLGSCSLGTYFAALSLLGIGEAAFLNHTSAIWVALLAPLLLGERTSGMIWLAIGGSLCGIALLAQPREGDLVGRLFGFASGLFAAGAYISVRRASQSNGPIAIIFYFTLVSTLLSSLALWALELPLLGAPEALPWLVAAGLSATGGQLLLTEAYRCGAAAPLAATAATGPLLTTLLGMATLGQVPDRKAWVGMALLLVCGLALPWFSAGRPNSPGPAVQPDRVL
jgi:S-adenosylmethionine uptake transporter